MKLLLNICQKDIFSEVNHGILFFCFEDCTQCQLCILALVYFVSGCDCTSFCFIVAHGES